MTNKPSFRPTLEKYRKIEDDLWRANQHIELGTKQLSDLQKKHDIQEQANKFLKEAIDTNNKSLLQALIEKNCLLERLTIERKKHSETLRISAYYCVGFAVIAYGIIIIRAIYGV